MNPANAEACVDAIIERVGSELRVAAPLGAGKPNHLLNALYRRAKGDPSLRLSIFSALTLQRPAGKSDLEKRFLGPFTERVFGNYPDLDYELDRVAGALPPNVRVSEFYFPAGKFVGNSAAQRDYISTNYTFVARDLMDREINVVVQQVAAAQIDGKPMLSLSCNADVSLDLMRMLNKHTSTRGPFVFVAQVNQELPFMYGDALVEPERFHLVVDNPDEYYLTFGPPKMSVDDTDTMIGLQASTLVMDGAELQVGIGSLSDAVVYGLQLRQRDNGAYRSVLDVLGIADRSGPLIERLGDVAPFERGLFSASEMLVDGFLHLFNDGIIKRKVYDDVPLQRLLNEGRIGEQVDASTLEALVKVRAVSERLTEDDVDYLRRFGVFKPEVGFEDGHLVLPDGRRLPPNLGAPASRALVVEHCLGESLQGGAVMHGGFFLGPQDFYQGLKDLPEERRKLIDMRSVAKINQLYGHEEIDRLHRRNARFINTGMMVTLLGAVVSDGLEDGTVISGVGGQYNFVSMAHALPDGRSVIQIRSTRQSSEGVVSNIVWNYGHTTIPRHLRDLVITEYGMVDLRGQTDEEVIKLLLSIADSRFQDGLAQTAKTAGKLSLDYEVPQRFRNNSPAAYGPRLAKLRQQGLFPPFPFGTDFTDIELALGKALKSLKRKTSSPGGLLGAAATAFMAKGVEENFRPHLERMGLSDPRGFKEKLYASLIAAELASQS